MLNLIVTLLLVYLGMMFVGFVISVIVGLIGKGTGFGFENTMRASNGALLFGVVISLFAFFIIGFGYSGNFENALRSLAGVFVVSVVIGFMYNMYGLVSSRSGRESDKGTH